MRLTEPPQNVLAPADIQALAGLAEFETVKSKVRLLAPFRMLGLGRLVNRFIAPFPLIRQLCFRHYTVCRSLPASGRRRQVGDGGHSGAK